MRCRRDLINEAKDSTKATKKEQEKKRRSRKKTGTKIKFQAAEVKLSLSKKVLVLHSIKKRKQYCISYSLHLKAYSVVLYGLIT